MSRKLNRPTTTLPNKNKSPFLFTTNKQPHQVFAITKIPYADIQKISLISQEELEVSQEREIEREREIKRIQIVLVKWVRDISEKGKKILYGNVQMSQEELNAYQNAIKSVIQTLHKFKFSIACYIIQTKQKLPAYKHSILQFYEQLAIAIISLCKAYPQSQQNLSISFQFMEHLLLQLLDQKQIILNQNNSTINKTLLFLLMRIYNLLFSIYDWEKKQELIKTEIGVFGDLIDIGDWAWQYFNDGGMRRRGEEGGQIVQNFVLCLLGFHIQNIKMREIELSVENAYIQHLQNLAAVYMQYSHPMLSSSLLLLLQTISRVQILMQNFIHTIWINVDEGIGRTKKQFQVLSTVMFEYDVSCGQQSMSKKMGKWVQLYLDNLAQKVIMGDKNIGRQPWLTSLTAKHSTKILKYLFTQPISSTLDTTPILLHLHHIIPILSSSENTHIYISHLVSFITHLSQLLKTSSSFLIPTKADTSTQVDEYVQNISSIFLYLDRQINIKIYFGHVQGSNEMIRFGRKMFGSRLFQQLSQDLEGVCKDDILDGMYVRAINIVVQDICQSSDSGLWFLGMVTLMMQLIVKCAKHLSKNGDMALLHKLGISLEFSLDKIKDKLQHKFSQLKDNERELNILNNFSEMPQQIQNCCFLLLEYCSEEKQSNLKIVAVVNQLLAIFVQGTVGNGIFCQIYYLVWALSFGRGDLLSRVSKNGDAVDVLSTFLILVSNNHYNQGDALVTDNKNLRYDILLKITVHLKNFCLPENMELDYQKVNSIFDISKLLSDYFLLLSDSREKKGLQIIEKGKKQIWRFYVKDCLGDMIDGVVISLRYWACQKLIQLIQYCEDEQKMENLVVALFQSTTLSATFLNKKRSKTCPENIQVCSFLSKHLKCPSFELFSKFLQSHRLFNDPSNSNLLLSCLGNQPIGCQQSQYQNIQFIPFSRLIKEKVNTIMKEYCRTYGIEVVKLGVVEEIQVALSESKKLRKIFKVRVEGLN